MYSKKIKGRLDKLLKGKKGFRVMKIRNATKSDFQRISELYEQVDRLHREAHPDRFQRPAEIGRTEEYLSALVKNEKAFLLVAEENGNVIGFAEAYIMSSPDFPVIKKRSWLLIDGIGVDESCRGTGAGQRLLNELEERIKEIGIHEVELKVYEFNNQAINFYEKNGFKELSRTMTKKL